MSVKIKKETIVALAQSRNHEFLDCEQFDTIYKDVNTKLRFQCNTCNSQFITTLRSYKNAKKTGCPECKRLTTQKTHKGKVLSETTKSKIGALNSKRPGSLTGRMGAKHPRYKGGYARDFTQKSNADYAWINGVKAVYGKACVLTKSKTDVVVHHLDGWNLFIEKRYDITNGVPLSKLVHKQFHNTYGYGNNTEAQFADFCANNFSLDWFAFKKSILENPKKENPKKAQSE
jgi:hypothetical protein